MPESRPHHSWTTITPGPLPPLGQRQVTRRVRTVARKLDDLCHVSNVDPIRTLSYDRNRDSTRCSPVGAPRRRLRQRPRPGVPLVVGAGRARPDRDRRCARLEVLGRARHDLDRLHEHARQHEPRASAPEDDPGDQGPGRHAVHGGPAVRQRPAQRGRPPDRREGEPRRGRRTLREGVLHERRRRGRRERRPPGQGLHGPDEGAVGLPQLPRRHGPHRRADRRTATPGERTVGAGTREVLGAVPVPFGVLLGLARTGDRTGTGPPARDDPRRGAEQGRGHRPRVGGRHERHPRPTARLPRGAAGAVRRVRHRLDRR